MRITIKQLTVFKAIHECGQISKAAKQLHLSVPALSMSLKELESTLQTKLFERGSGGLTLNASGQMALSYVNGILGQMDELTQRFQAQACGDGGTLTIGANKTCGNYVLSKRLPQFKQYHPAINTRLRISDSAVIEQMVIDNELDVGFVSTQPTATGIAFQPWLNDRLVIVASPDHKLTKRVPRLEELSAATWVLDEENTALRVASLTMLQGLGVAVNDQIVMNTMGSIKRAIGTGLGLAILPLLAVDAELERGDLREVMVDSELLGDRTINVIYRADRLTPLVQRFLDFCQISLKQQ